MEKVKNLDVTPYKNSAAENDETLVSQIQQGNGEMFQIIAERYFSIIEIKANSIASTDTEDIIQEGLMGLWGAVQTYKTDKNTSFKTYAFKCIENAMRSAVKKGKGKKQIPQGNIVYLNNENSQYLNDRFAEPEQRIIEQENYWQTVEKIKRTLSAKEWKVLSYYLAGNSYKRIAQIMNCDKKAVDNAIQRIRRKLKQ